jgi:hypothetical protein
MNPFAPRYFRGLWIASVLALSLVWTGGVSSAQSTNRQIGTQYTATADPVVSRPHTRPCVVQLFSGYTFAFFSNSVQTFSFMPPAACPGPWSKVVFEANFSENAGVQFDRTASMYIANTDIYFGTTPEPLSNATNTWHVERDITDYSALLTVPQQGTIVLANCTTDCPPPYNTFLNGIFTVNADLEFYPLRGDDDSSRTPDVVLPLEQSNGSGGFNLPVILGSATDQLTTTFNLPTNIERIYMDVVPQSQSGDEFWYTCVPNNVSAELFSCGNTGFREAEISVDGQPAGVAPVSPWIYTGGIDPYLWFPIPGVQTLDFVPYRVDLTPFAGALSDGNPHTVAMSVFNDNGYFSVTGTLLLFLDHASSKVSGAVTKNTLSAAPSPMVTENLNVGSTITGTVKVTSHRSFTISGYVNTSHGKVSTTVSQNINFANNQSFDITSTLYVQDINQNTDVSSKTTVSRSEGHSTYLQNFYFPLVVDISQTTEANGNINQTTTARQTYEVDTIGAGDNPGFLSLVKNSGQHQDTLTFSPSFALLGNSNQSATQHYTSANSDGQFYDCQIAAQNNTLTKVSRGCTPGDH